MRRRPSFDYGRWLLQRQRLQIADAAPPLPGGPSPIGGTVRAVLRQIGLQSDLWKQSLCAEWPAIVGETLARRTRPGRIEGGALTVYVRHSIFLQELSRDPAVGARLLANLRERFPAAPLRTVRFQIDPGEQDDTSRDRPPPGGAPP